MTALKFSKGGKAKSPVRTPDTMVSTDTVEVLLGISEGPIKGLENGARSFMADDTPLENTSGEANFQNFELDVWPGTEAGHVVTLDLGGFSNPKTIGVTLAKDVPVVRAGQTAGIDAVDFRIVVAQLLKQTDEGVFTNRMTLKFEVKKTTDAAWTLAWFNAPSTTNPGGAVGGGSGDGGGGGYTAGGHHLSDERRTVINFNGPGIDMGDRTTYRSYGRVNDLLTFDGDIQTALVAGVPTAPPANPDLPAVAVNTVTNGVYHWASGSWTVDTPTTETGYKVLNDGRRLYDQSDTPPSGARTGDLWLKMQLGVLQIILVWNGGAWVKPSEYQAEAPTTPADGIWDTYAKVSSATPKDIRVFLPNPQPGDMWEYRVTKLSNDTGTEEFSEIQWESVQEISRTPMAFNGVAMARVIGRASDQFTALPQWTGDWMGRIVKVASNYDPIAKTYAGIWDGLYKIEWTDNNAWIFQDFVENDRYGLSSIFPHTVNKWKIYEFAQHCDVKVLRPDGSLRPRWTYNDYIQEPRDAKELASYIAGSAGARYVDDGNGVVEVVIDKDDPAIAIFTPENIGEDGFSYSYSDRLTRANEVTVEFVNPTLNWQRDKRIVRDDADIALYGRIPENFIAVGCTDVDEALARARRRLIGGLTEKEIATFTTNRKGRFLAEWSVILLGDPEMGRGITGRIRAVTGARSVSLRDPLAFEPGITYWASFDIVNPDYPATSSEPFKLERRQITNSAGADQTTLTFASDLPALPEYATFILEAPDVAGFPKPYRVTNIGDDSGTGDQIRITCLELNRNKWAYIDTGEGEGDLIYSDFSSKIVLPPVNPTLVVTTRARGTGATRAIEVRWDKSPSRWVRRYKVYHAVDGVPQKAIDATTTSIEIEGAESGTHTFAIVAIDIRGRESLPLTLTYNVTGDARPVAPPTNLTLVGGLLPTVFEDLSPKVMWDAPPASPNFKNYRLVISDTSSDAQLRIVELATELEYRYDFLMNRDDGLGTATRDLTFTLYAVDQDDNLSPPVELSINNPAPFAPTITVTATMGGVNVVLSPSTERDVVGAKLSVSTVSGVTAVAQDANQGSFFVPLADGDLRYIKAAYYDKFSSSDLFWSAESSVTRGGIADVDLPATAPATVSGTPTLSFASTINPDGTQVTNLTAGWTAVSAATGYDIEINDGVTPWTEWSPVASIKNLRVQPGRTYTVKVKAVGRTGLRSAAWSTTSASVAAGGDVTAPSNPTSITITALARRIVLAWTPYADADYSHLKLYRNTTGTSPAGTGEADLYRPNVTGSIFADTNVTAGVPYYYWGKPVDRTGNVGALNYFGTATPTYVTVAGGDVLSTDPVLVTSQGVAASVSGQTGWATYGTLTPATVQGRVGNLDASGNLTSLSNINTRSLSLLTGRTADQLTYVSGGATVESLRPGEAGANVTEGRVAASVTGQTSWATYGSYTPSQVATPVATFLSPRTQSSVAVAAGSARWHRVARVVSSVGRGAMRVTLGFNGGGATPSALVLDVSRDWDVNGTISIVSNGTGCPITQARLSRGTGESYLDVYIGANSAFDMMISVEPLPGTEGVWAVNYVSNPTVGATLIGTIPLTDASGANRVTGVMTNGTYTLVSAAGGLVTNGVAAVNASGVSFDVTHGADRAVLERGANITETRTASAITGQTGWATYGTLTPATVQGRVGNLDASGNLTSLSNINTRSLSLLTGRTADQLTYVTGGATVESLRPGEAGANVTETRTASAITGQTDWATYTGRSVNALNTAIFADGYLQSGLNARVRPLEMMGGIAGTNLALNPEFADGSAANYSVYNNAGGAKVTIAVEYESNAPNNSRYVLKVSYDGTGTPNSNPSPGFGGVYQGLTYTTGAARPGQYTLNSRILYKVMALIPVGRTLTWHGNSMGVGSTVTPLTSMEGTGSWQLYVFEVFTGAPGGSPSSVGHLAVHNGANTSFDWYLARYDQIDTSGPAATFINTGLRDSSGARRGDADLITVQGVAASFTGQGGLATANTISGDGQLSGVIANRLQGGDVDGNYLNAGRMLYPGTGGASVSSLRPGEFGANVTESRTAAAITGQGVLATRGTVAATHIDAGAVTPSRQSIRDTSNMFRDSDMSGDASLWITTPGSFVFNPSSGLSLDVASTNYVLITTAGSTRAVRSNYEGSTPVEPGRVYYVSAVVFSSVPAAAATAYATFYDRAGALISSTPIIGSNTTTSPTRVTALITPPSNAVRMGFWFEAYNTGYGYFAEPIIRRASRLGDLVYRETGAVLTDAVAVTSLGVAATIAGQTAWATATIPGGLTPTIVGNRSQNLDNTTGAFNSLSNITTRPLDALTGRTADKVNYIGGGGVTMEVLRPQEANANVTETRTASAITGQGPGATAVSNRVLNDRYEGGVKLIQQPDGGQLNIPTSNQVGQLEIVFPFAWNAVSPMITFDVVVHDYSTGRTSTYTVAGHHYNTGSNGWWANVTATFNGPRAFSRPVKFGFNAAGKATIWIGSVGDLWQYPNVTIRNVQVGYASQVNDWATGWSISLNNTAISGTYVNMTTPYWVRIVDVPRSGDQVFGEGLLEQAGGAVATRANFRTDQGVAASISGQAATATSSDFASVTGATRPANNATVGADWTTNLTNRAPVTQGDSLTEDPSGADPSAWAGAVGSFVSITDGEVATTAMRLTGGTLIGARRVPVDAAKTYMIECWMRRTGTTNTAYGLASLRDGAGSEINGDGSYWLYWPQGTTIPATWTYYSRVFGAGTGKTIPANAVTMAVGALPNYNGASGAVEIQGLRIVEVTTVGGSLRRADGSLATEAALVTGLGTAASITGQSVLATNSDFAGVTGATRPSPNAGTSGILTPLGSFSTVVGNSVSKSGTHGALEGGAVGSAQRGSAYIRSSLLSVAAGGGWYTQLALDDDATTFNTSTQKYWCRYVTAGGSPGSLALYSGDTTLASATIPVLTLASRMTLGYDGSTVFVDIDGVRYCSSPAPAGQTLWPKIIDFYNSAASTFPAAIVDIQYGAWTENTAAVAALVPYNSETVVSGSTATKVGGSHGSWGGGVSSRDKYVGAAYCSFRVGESVQPYFMAGLAAPGFGGDYNTINYSCYTTGLPGSQAMRAYAGGIGELATLAAAGAWALTDVWSVVYDGVRVQWLQNGVVRYTYAAAAGQTLGFAASQVYFGNQLADIQVGPANQVARIGHNTYDDTGGALVGRTGLITSLGTASSISGQTAAATAPDVQVFNDRKQGNVTHIALPVGGTNENSGSADMGAWRIVLPVTWNYAMISFEVEVQRYGGGGAVVYQIYGYTYDYGGGSHGWINSSVKATGDRFGFQNVYMHKDPATGRPAVDIGLVNSTTWPYSKVSVKNVRVGHTPGTVADWDDGWTVTLTNAARGADSYTIGAGSIGQDAVFGENCWETEAKATLATRANFRTDQGVASSYAGQTLLATQTFPTHAGVAAAKAAGLTDGRQFYDSTNSNLLTAVTSAAGGFGATASHTNRSGSRSGAGSVTTSTVTVTPTGAGGSVSYSWYRISGDTGISATSSTGAATAFTGSVGVGETKSATFACAATDAGTGKTVTLLVTASITETT